MAAVAETPAAPALDSNPTTETSDAAGQGKIVTVFDDADNFNVKHPLAHTWTLWFTKPPSGKGDNWADLLKEVISFDSVEEFWGIYNNVAPVSELPVKADYHLFKKGVRPEWEDAQNKHGGRWSFTTKDRKSVPIDKIWLNALLAAIGEQVEEETDGEVMGVVVNVRKAFYRIGLWTRTVGKPFTGGGDGNTAGGRGRSQAAGEEIIKRIGTNFKAALEIPPTEAVDFSGHSESASQGSTRARSKFTV